MNAGNILELVPMVFSYWSGILIAWSLSLGGLLVYVVERVFSITKHCPRATDYLYTFISLLGCLILALLIFVFPNYAISVVDVLLIANMWFTLFLFHASHVAYMAISRLRHCGECPPVDNKKAPEGPFYKAKG